MKMHYLTLYLSDLIKLLLGTFRDNVGNPLENNRNPAEAVKTASAGFLFLPLEHLFSLPSLQ